MSANNERFFQMMLIALTLLIVLAVSQARAAEQIITIPLGNKGASDIRENNGSGLLSVDILSEIKKQAPDAVKAGLDLRSVRVDAISSVGGAQLMLQAKTQAGESYVDSIRIQTDPMGFKSNTGFKTFELLNRERVLQGLKLIGVNPLKIKNLRAVLIVPEMNDPSVQVPSQVPGDQNAWPVPGGNQQQPMPQPEEYSAQGQMPQQLPNQQLNLERPADWGDGAYEEAPPANMGLQPGQNSNMNPNMNPNQFGEQAPMDFGLQPGFGQQPGFNQPPFNGQGPLIEQDPTTGCFESFCFADLVIQRRTGIKGRVVGVDVRRRRLIVRLGLGPDWYNTSVSAQDLVHDR